MKKRRMRKAQIETHTIFILITILIALILIIYATYGWWGRFKETSQKVEPEAVISSQTAPWSCNFEDVGLRSMEIKNYFSSSFTYLLLT